MTSHRLIDDAYTYISDTWQSVRPLQFTTNPIRFNHCNPCRIELGVTGGNNVSLIKGNMVDLESDLLGITRPVAQCPCHKYLPAAMKYGTNNILIESKGCNKPRWIDTTPQHLPACNIQTYPPVCTPEPIHQLMCDRPRIVKQ